MTSAVLPVPTGGYWDKVPWYRNCLRAGCRRYAYLSLSVCNTYVTDRQTDRPSTVPAATERLRSAHVYRNKCKLCLLLLCSVVFGHCSQMRAMKQGGPIAVDGGNFLVMRSASLGISRHWNWMCSEWSNTWVDQEIDSLLHSDCIHSVNIRLFPDGQATQQ